MATLDPARRPAPAPNKAPAPAVPPPARNPAPPVAAPAPAASVQVTPARPVPVAAPIAAYVRALEPVIPQVLTPVVAAPPAAKPSLATRALGALGLAKPPPAPARGADLVILIDTSGSMGESVQRCSAALARLARQARGPDAQVRIIAHTMRVEVDRTVAASTLMERGYPISAGGGTDYRDALALLARDRVASAIWLTDGDGFLDSEPTCAITWAITRLNECPLQGSHVGSRCRRGELPTAVIDLVS